MMKMRAVFLVSFLCIALHVVNAAASVQKCKKVVDIAMVVDESGSIGISNFEKVKSFLQDTVSRFSVTRFGAHFGLVKYSSYPRLVFQLDKYENVNEIRKAIQVMDYRGGSTKTGKAMEYTRTRIFGRLADRKDVPNVLVLFSDGRSHDHKKAVRETQQMKKEGVEILCVGIGEGAVDTSLITQLRELASKPEYVFKTAFNALNAIEESLVKDMCEAINPCKDRPCQNNGKCLQDGDSYKCVCEQNYEGKNCENKKNPCQSGPCQNNGKCSQEGDSYKCVCTPNYEGKNCEQKKNPCQSGPCQNNGKCSQEGDSYKCVCTPNYEGKNCEQKKNPCQSGPCQNNGKCSQEGDSYKCICTPNYEGKNCEQKKWCPATFSKRGCYKMPRTKESKQLLFNRRKIIEWTDKWDQFIEKLVCDCGKKAKELGFNYFCIEFYGECWGYTYKQLDIPGQTADAGKCWGKRPIYDKCDHNLKNPICVGVGFHGYVYELQ